VPLERKPENSILRVRARKFRLVDSPPKWRVKCRRLLTREQIEAFFRGDELPPDVMEEITRAIDDPKSLVSRMSAEYARITRLMFDPNGPLMPPPAGDQPNPEGRGDGGLQQRE
jgi:hypothetical protein